MELDLDPWQKKVLEVKGNIALRTGRQVGKTTVISIKAAEYAIQSANKVVMVVSSVERQAQHLFSKILNYMEDKYKRLIKRGRERPTRHKISLTNGSVIHCLPTGLDGHGIRGYTVDLLIADEAAFIPEEVWTAITPMLATTKGDVVLLSTPFGREGYFYRCFEDETFTTFHVTSEQCKRIDKKFLDQEKKRMTELQYAQEYLGEFIDELRQYFPTKLIEELMTVEPVPPSKGKYYLGVDIARLGGDQNAYASVQIANDEVIMKDLQIRYYQKTNETTNEIVGLDRVWDYKRIYIDDGGIGAAILDNLIEMPNIGRRVEGINNARKSIEKGSNRQRRLLKEDLYANLLRLMEQRKIRLLKSPELLKSLKSVQYEYSDYKMRIFGNDTHIAEALIRAVWAVKAKNLNMWVVSNNNEVRYVK